MSELKLYNVMDEYITYLRKSDKKVFSNKEEDRLKERKYAGIVLTIKEFKYFVPLSSPKDSDYELINNEKQIRKSIIPIMRIVAKNVLGEYELKGTLKFSNMIPVPECALINYDVEKEKNENYKILVIKELSFIFSNSKQIIKNAQVIYNQKTNNFKNGYLKQTVDFLLLEVKSKEYQEAKEIITAAQAQVAIAESKLINGQPSD